MSTDTGISEAFAVIAAYAERQGWVPIGHRTWMVGPWRITVNGTREPVDAIPPFHALVEHTEYVGVLLLHPHGGGAVGWSETETEFLRAMRQALNSDEATRLIARDEDR